MVEPGIKGVDGTVNELIQSTSASGSNSNDITHTIRPDSNTINKSTSNNISKSSPAGVSIVLFKEEFMIKLSISYWSFTSDIYIVLLLSIKYIYHMQYKSYLFITQVKP